MILRKLSEQVTILRVVTGDKQTEIEDKLRFYVRHYNIDEKEWNEIVKPYAEGLSGLPYEDFK